VSGRVLIVGRPNVGKSSLFNRLTGSRKAIVEDVPGVTRDLIEGKARWRDRTFTVVDTGGLVTGRTDEILDSIKRMISEEIPKADVILFVVDGKEGITPLDQEIARLLMGHKDRVILVVNKIDTERDEIGIGEFYSLGFEEVYPVSALHGRGTGDLLDRIIQGLPDRREESEEGIRIALIGKPSGNNEGRG